MEKKHTIFVVFYRLLRKKPHSRKSPTSGKQNPQQIQTTKQVLKTPDIYEIPLTAVLITLFFLLGIYYLA